MAKTVQIDGNDVTIDENYYVLFKMLEKIIKELRTLNSRPNGR